VADAMIKAEVTMLGKVFDRFVEKSPLAVMASI